MRRPVKHDHLTEPDPELARLREKTPPGMAHWAGTGPEGKTCGGCNHWGYWYETRAGISKRKTSCCEVYYRHLHIHGGSLPATTPACKYFG